MISPSAAWAIAFAIALLVLAVLWLAIPMLTGLPWIPTRRPRILAALEMAHVGPQDLVFDLGAGDGRVLVVAARYFGAHAVGVEISPLHCAVAWIRVRASGVADRVRVRLGDYHSADLSGADVVFAYLTRREASRLAPILARQLRAGARVVTVGFDFAEWLPAAFSRKDLIYLYLMPPEPGSLGVLLEHSQPAAT